MSTYGIDPALGVLVAITAGGPFYNPNKTSGVSWSIPADQNLYITDYVEISLGDTVEIGAGATLEIG